MRVEPWNVIGALVRRHPQHASLHSAPHHGRVQGEHSVPSQEEGSTRQGICRYLHLALPSPQNCEK